MLDASYGINSNALNNKLYTTVYEGGFIEDDLKLQQYDKLKKINRVGGDANINTGVAFRLKNKKNNINYLGLTISQKYHYRAKFSDDLFKLILSGNSIFIGNSAYFNQNSINYLNYQQVNLNYTAIREKHSIKMGISYLKGVDFFNLNVKDGELYTNYNFTQLYLQTSYSIQLPDTSGTKKWSDFNGHGGAVNLSYSGRISSSNSGNTFLNIAVSDLGLLVWNKNSLSARVDTAIKFKGIELNNIFQLNDSNLTGLSTDSLKKSFLPLKKDRITILLPAWFDLSFKTFTRRNTSLQYGIKYRLMADYNLFGYIAMQHRFNKFISAGMGFSYGGYGVLNTSLELKLCPFKNYELLLQTNNLLSQLFPSSTFGQGLLVSMRYGF